MARGNKGDSNLKLFFMKITGMKDGEKVHIKQTEAREKGNHVELDETVQDVSGQLVKVEVREYTPRPDEKARELKITLKDEKAGEMYILGCNMNSIGRGILNTILGLEAPYGELMIRVYNGKDDKAFPKAYVTHNGAKVGWKYTIEELKKHIVTSPVVKQGVTTYVKDYWNLDTFLIEDLNANVVPNFAKVPSEFQDAPNREQPPVDTLEPEGVGEQDELDVLFKEA